MLKQVSAHEDDNEDTVSYNEASLPPHIDVN